MKLAALTTLALFSTSAAFAAASNDLGRDHGDMMIPVQMKMDHDDHDASGHTYTKGVVKKIDADKGKVTIIHEELTELNMPAMTMVFLADEDIIGQLSEGQEIEFSVERLKGKLTVTGLK